MTREWVVVANYWKEFEGWTHEEEVDRLNDYMDAKTYVNSLDDDTLAAYFEDHHDAVQFDILDEDGNKVSDDWVDRDDAVDHWTLIHVGGEHDGLEIAVTEDEENAFIMARDYNAKHEDEPDFLGVLILDRYGNEVKNWQAN